MMKNILVPVDGSEGADRAIEQAVTLAKICGAKLNFLYVANINQLAINAVLSDAILASTSSSWAAAALESSRGFCWAASASMWSSSPSVLFSW